MKELIDALKATDWYYQKATIPEYQEQAEQVAAKVLGKLEEFSRQEGGLLAALRLYRRYIPEGAVATPAFLQAIAQADVRLQSMNRSSVEAAPRQPDFRQLLGDLRTLYAKDPVSVQLLLEVHGANIFFHYLNEDAMNEKNLEALKKNLTYLGIGEALHEQLEKKIAEQPAEFSLLHEVAFNKRAMTMRLQFRAGEHNEMYFLNSYQATLKDDPARTQSFDLSHRNTITAKEAFNLLEGRAVNKDWYNREGQKYNAWVQLDLQAEKDKYNNHKVDRYHENYNYDIHREVKQLVLKPMTPDEESQLIASLKKGNVQSVTFLKGGEELRGFIEANPRARTLNMYDAGMKPMSPAMRNELTDILSPSRGREIKQVPDAGDEEGPGEPELTRKRSRKKSKGLQP